MSDWRTNLAEFYNNLDSVEKKREHRVQMQREEITKVISEVVVPAFKELADEFKKHDRQVQITEQHDRATIQVVFQGETEMILGIKAWGSDGQAVWVSTVDNEGTERAFKADMEDMLKDFIISSSLSIYYEKTRNKKREE